jgi:hypothetical protein
MNSLYRKLSLFVHPNPAGHQHIPVYETKKLKKWVFLMKEMLKIMIWLYVKCVKYLGYDEKATTDLNRKTTIWTNVHLII